MGLKGKFYFPGCSVGKIFTAKLEQKSCICNESNHSLEPKNVQAHFSKYVVLHVYYRFLNESLRCLETEEDQSDT